MEVEGASHDIGIVTMKRTAVMGATRMSKLAVGFVIFLGYFVV